MQPIYITQSSAGSSPWKLTNWHCTGPMNIGVSVVGNSTSTWQIDYTVDDPTGSFPNPTLGASAPTVFTTMSGSSTATYGGVHDAGRRDPADDECAVERGRQGDRDDPAGRDRMRGHDAVAIGVGMPRCPLYPGERTSSAWLVMCGSQQRTSNDVVKLKAARRRLPVSMNAF